MPSRPTARSTAGGHPRPAGADQIDERAPPPGDLGGYEKIAPYVEVVEQLDLLEAADQAPADPPVRWQPVERHAPRAEMRPVLGSEPGDGVDEGGSSRRRLGPMRPTSSPSATSSDRWETARSPP